LGLKVDRIRLRVSTYQSWNCASASPSLGCMVTYKMPGVLLDAMVICRPLCEDQVYSIGDVARGCESTMECNCSRGERISKLHSTDVRSDAGEVLSRARSHLPAAANAESSRMQCAAPPILGSEFTPPRSDRKCYASSARMYDLVSECSGSLVNCMRTLTPILQRWLDIKGYRSEVGTRSHDGFALWNLQVQSPEWLSF